MGLRPTQVWDAPPALIRTQVWDGVELAKLSLIEMRAGMDGVIFGVPLFATVFCAAVNGYTYQVAYPLWRTVSDAELAGMHREYLKRLWPVITVPHMVMFFASGALIWKRPGFMPLWVAGLVFALDAAVVVVSAVAAGPIHDRITKLGRMDEVGYRGLMSISAMRVVLMALACGLMFAMTLRALMIAR